MGIYETLKDIAKLVQKADNVAVQRALLDAQHQALALQDDNHSLRQRVAQLEAALAFSDELEFDGRRFYVRKGSPDEKYCPGCWDSKKQAYRITQHVSGRPHCAVCGTIYEFR